MISAQDLFPGIVVKTQKRRRNMHCEFALFTCGNYWIRFNPSFGQIAGVMNADRLIKYLNRYNFEIIGKYELKLYTPEPIPESFKFNGAL